MTILQGRSPLPVGPARRLLDSGITLEIANGSRLFPQRQIKTAAKVGALRKGNAGELIVVDIFPRASRTVTTRNISSH